MINLFNIPTYKIDTAKFSNILHDEIVDEFSHNFCKYVGGKYCCPTNSATNAIFLLSYYMNIEFSIPAMLPPVVLNAIKNGASYYKFVDDIDWVGNSYLMYDNNIRIIDSVQEVKHRKFKYNDIVIYSFYPTKPVGSCDGGMIVSNNKDLIDFFKIAVNNGSKQSHNSWKSVQQMSGWKMYMNSIQAYIANKNLKKLNNKKASLSIIRELYNNKFGYNNKFDYNNISEHLYRITVKNNTEFIKYMLSKGITCGIHYKCLRDDPNYCDGDFPLSNIESRHTASIPFHEKLTNKEINKVIKCVRSSGMMV